MSSVFTPDRGVVFRFFLRSLVRSHETRRLQFTPNPPRRYTQRQTVTVYTMPPPPPPPSHFLVFARTHRYCCTRPSCLTACSLAAKLPACVCMCRNLGQPLMALFVSEEAKSVHRKRGGTLRGVIGEESVENRRKNHKKNCFFALVLATRPPPFPFFTQIRRKWCVVSCVGACTRTHMRRRDTFSPPTRAGEPRKQLEKQIFTGRQAGRKAGSRPWLAASHT